MKPLEFTFVFFCLNTMASFICINCIVWGLYLSYQQTKNFETKLLLSLAGERSIKTSKIRDFVKFFKFKTKKERLITLESSDLISNKE